MATGLAASLALTSCAHLAPAASPVEVVSQAVNDACVPFVVEGIDRAEVGRRLGPAWWLTPPDPFAPILGGLFRSGPATIRVDDGRSARTQDGSLTTRPVRICNLWLGERIDETLLIAAVGVAAAGYRPEARIIHPVRVDGARRTVVCLPLEGERVAVVNALVFANGQGGVSVYEADAASPDCAR